MREYQEKMFSLNEIMSIFKEDNVTLDDESYDHILGKIIYIDELIEDEIKS